MSDFLTLMSEESARRAARAQSERAAIEERARAAASPSDLDLSEHRFAVLAEAKLASPSEGRLATSGDDATTVVTMAREYLEGGAVGISVLTEETRFGGALDHLESVSRSVSLPVMRKDFLVDPLQVLEARASGASGVLLIARMLPRDLLEEMTDLTLALGMFALVEVFDRSDLELAAAVLDRDVLIGVNSRDLATLEVDRQRFATLAPHLPDHLPAVAESGISTTDHVREVASLGYRMALVGSSLVRGPDRAQQLRELIAAGSDVMTGTPS